MICINEHIEYLLRRHDCVVVPGWGAFIAQYRGAWFDAEREVIVPPSRSISFNGSITHNDGMIATSVMRREGIGYDAAVSAIAGAVDLMRHQLEATGEVAVGKLGVFSKSDDNPMEFVPSDLSTRLSVYSGLSTVKAVDIAAQEQRRREAERRRGIEERSSRRSLRVNIMRVAASIALLIGVGIVLSTPVPVNESPLFASVASAFEPKQPAQELPDVAALESRYSGEMFVAIPSREEYADAESEPVEETVEIAEEVNEEPAAGVVRFNDGDSYCLVIASLASRQLAESFIATSGESCLGILEQDGKFRVYAATGSTAAEARDSSVLARYPDAWTCRR